MNEQDKPLTTLSNPANFQPLKLSFRKIISQLRSYLKKKQFKGAFYHCLVTAVNINDSIFQKKLKAKVYCPCCGYTGRAFLHLSNEYRIAWNSACPQCSSRSRHRGLSIYGQKIMGGESVSLKQILHFAPEPVLSQLFKKKEGIVYQTADLFLKDVDIPSQNLESLTIPDAQYDLVICNHVLEHVKNDSKAVSELSRILKPGAFAWVTLPGNWDGEKTREYNHPDENGHHRHYGLDVMKIFEKYFSGVKQLDLHDVDGVDAGLSKGISKGEILFILKK